MDKSYIKPISTIPKNISGKSHIQHWTAARNITNRHFQHLRELWKGGYKKGYKRKVEIKNTRL